MLFSLEDPGASDELTATTHESQAAGHPSPDPQRHLGSSLPFSGSQESSDPQPAGVHAHWHDLRQMTKCSLWGHSQLCMPELEASLKLVLNAALGVRALKNTYQLFSHLSGSSPC